MLQKLGFSYRSQNITGAYLSVPLWPLAVLTGLPLFVSALVRRRTSRASLLRRGLCVHCGYDLRATPDRCPECGRAAPGFPAAAAAAIPPQAAPALHSVA